jgi:hypothetical protein
MAELTLFSLSRDGLAGFAIVEMTEVYQVNEDNKKAKSLGFFRDEKIAKGFANCQTDAAWYKTAKYWILTNGKIGFMVMKDPVILLKDEQAVMKIREKVLAKLTPEEREILFKISGD